MNGSREIAQERQRQMSSEGYNRRHDNEHDVSEFELAALAYITGNAVSWPWHESGFKPTGRRRDLVKAGALIAAAIDRLDSRGGAAIGDRAKARIYVKNNCWQTPTRRHIPLSALPHMAFCGIELITSIEHEEQLSGAGRVDYSSLPICKSCLRCGGAA